MSPSDKLPENHPEAEQDRDQGLAVAVEVLYVVNLLLLPLLAFAVMLWIFLTRHHQATPLARSHIEQTMSACVWMAALFIAVAGCIMLLSILELSEPGLWIIGVTLFTIIHASMVLLGVIGLAKAMAGKCWRYPFVGRELPVGCDD